MSAGFGAVSSVAGVRYSYGVVIPHLSQHLAVPTATLAAAFTLHWLVFTLSAPLAWRGAARLGVPTMFRLGGLACGIGFGMLAVVERPWQAAACFGVLVALGTHGIGQLSSNQPVLGAAHLDRRDRMFGIVACGSPVGTALFPALAALVTAHASWRYGALAVGIAVVAVTWLAAGTVQPVVRRAVPAPVVTTASKLVERRFWLDRSFGLLAAAFFLCLIVQTSIPFILPMWGADLEISSERLATAFALLGGSGLIGRLVMTSFRPAFSLRLWPAVPCALLTMAGCIAALAAADPWWFLVSVVLLGISTPVFGALFAIACVACFPASRFPQVAGGLLYPAGVGAALAPMLPVLAFDHGLRLPIMWAAISLMTVVTAGLLVVAEILSPLRASRKDSTTG